jgi:hypothetical protein
MLHQIVTRRTKLIYHDLIIFFKLLIKQKKDYCQMYYK